MARKIILTLAITYLLGNMSFVSADNFELPVIGGIDLSAVFGQTCTGIKPGKVGLFNASLCVLTEGISGEYQEQYKPDRFYETNRAEELLKQFDEEELKRQYGNEYYDKEKSTGVFQVDFRGLPIVVSYPYPNDSRLLFAVPSLGIEKTFVGTSRDDSNQQLKDYLKKDANEILKKLTEVSPVDPIPPAQYNQIQDEFNTGTGNSFEPIDFGADLPGLFGVGFRYEHHNVEGRSITYFTLPLQKSFSLGEGKELVFRLPLEYREVESAKVYQIIGGLSYKTPVSNKWFLTPSISYGVVGSRDLASVAQIVSTSLTSEVLLIGGTGSKYSLSMGNLVGYSETLPFRYKDYDLSVERRNTITRNGILLSMVLPKNFLEMEMIAEVFLVDTRALGDPLYQDHYNEIGFAIGPKRLMTRGDKSFVNTSTQLVGLGFRYFHSDVSNGWRFSIGYKF